MKGSRHENRQCPFLRSYIPSYSSPHYSPVLIFAQYSSLELNAAVRAILPEDLRSLWQPIRSPSPVRHPTGRALLSALPVEILMMMINFIESTDDVVRLGLTNRTFWQLSYRWLQKVFSQDYGSWAGDRLVCFGDYFKLHDLPEGVSPDDLKHGTLAMRKPYIPDGYYSEEFPEWRILGSERHDSLMGSLYPPLVRAEMLYDLNRDWVLCNLTKREYIRADTIAEATQTTNNRAGPFIGKRLNLGNVLVTRICWSSDSSIDLPYEGDITRGVWAGDRFEITTTDRIKDMDMWKDVSDDVVKEIEAIWGASCTGNWKEWSCW